LGCSANAMATLKNGSRFTPIRRSKHAKSSGAYCKYYAFVFLAFLALSLFQVVMMQDLAGSERVAELTPSAAENNDNKNNDKKVEIHAITKVDFKPDVYQLAGPSGTGEIFEPGSLDLSRTESIARCFVNQSLYKVEKNLCAYSSKYHLYYYLIPKSGSSSGRHIMKGDFAAYETSTCAELSNLPGTKKTVSVRNPLSRFYASYDEAFVRRLPKQHSIPTKYRRFMEPWKGKDYDYYKTFFDTKDGVKLLTDTFEKFVHDYDGEIPYDVHLHLQMPMIWNRTANRMQPFDLAFDTHEMGKAFEDIAADVGAPKPNIIRGRSYPRRFNVSALSDATLQKICRLAAIDWCCLNYELPEPCKRAPPGQRVKCQYVYPFGSSEKYIQPVLV